MVVSVSKVDFHRLASQEERRCIKIAWTCKSKLQMPVSLVLLVSLARLCFFFSLNLAQKAESLASETNVLLDLAI